MKRKLSVPEKHQLRIAKATLRMSDAAARVMGGMTKEEAQKIVHKKGGQNVKGIHNYPSR